MDFGASMFFTDYSMTPGELAAELEQRGFESVWSPEHSHIPVSRRSPWPGGAELPKQYYDVLDPFVALTHAAAATARLKVGTGICLVIQRDPIQTAKEVASLDVLSGGRFLFGVGGGWNAEEIADHGTAFETRFKVMRERIEAMKEIWTNKEAEYHGQFVDFEPMFAWPKPKQQPHPPIIVGGAFPHGARRAIAYGDGWMPIPGRGGDILELIAKFRQMVAEAGRDASALPVTVFGAPENADALKRLRDAGVVRVIVTLPAAKSDTVLPILDRWSGLMR